MKKMLNNYVLPFSILIYLLLFIFLWQYYQYVFDVDGVGYSIVAEHFSNGNWFRAINGFWSPLHSWLVAPFLKSKIAVRDVFFISNAFISLVILVLINCLQIRLGVNSRYKLPTLLSAVVLLLHFSFFELAADILLIPFLLAYILMFLKDDFFLKKKYHFFCAIIIGFAYLAKTYALPFLVTIHGLFFSYHYCKTRDVQWSNLLVFLLTLTAFCMPWVLIISNKYQIFTIGNSSSLNQSWFLGEPVNKNSFFRYPHYSDSVGWWEDPYYMQGEFVNMFSSFGHFIKQIRVFFYNIFLFLNVLMECSAFSITILLGLLFRSIYQKNIIFTKLSIFIIFFPAGYLLTFIEGRYVWIYNLLFLIIGVVFLQEVIEKYVIKRKWEIVILSLFFGSFLFKPIDAMKDTAIHDRGKDCYEIAEFLKKNTKALNFTSNTRSSEGQVIGYLSKRRFFHLNQSAYTYKRFKDEMKKSGIGILIFFYKSEFEKVAVINEFASNGAIKTKEMKPGVLVLEIIN